MGDVLAEVIDANLEQIIVVLPDITKLIQSSSGRAVHRQVQLDHEEVVGSGGTSFSRTSESTTSVRLLQTGSGRSGPTDDRPVLTRLRHRGRIAATKQTLA